MTLAPQSRVLLTDALRPPAGHRVDVAVGTTYSLDLTALLVAPLSFALVDHERMQDAADAPGVSMDPVRLLEAVRRHVEHTTVFCQGGAIHVPRTHQSILAFVEDAVIQVTPPSLPGQPEGIFHPKVWALRFRSESGERFHRVVVLSRNLTLDRSWDTILVLDEDPGGTIPAAPAAHFLRALPGLALPQGSGTTPARMSQVLDLAGSLEQVSLTAPAPFDGGRLVPLGPPFVDEGDPDNRQVASLESLLLPERAERILAISPFLTPEVITRLGKAAPERVLISRPDSLDGVGSRALAGWETRVLQRQAETVEADSDASAVSSDPVPTDGAATDDGVTEFQTGDGLHAKTVIADLSHGRSRTVTGSANLTRAAWTRNIEFDSILTGPTARCGVSSCMAEQEKSPGLRDLTERYAPASTEPLTESSLATSLTIEHFHRVLAGCQPRLTVSSLPRTSWSGAPADDTSETDPLSITLSFGDDTWTQELPAQEPGWTTRLWPVSLAVSSAHRLTSSTSSSHPPMWTLGSPSSITPFLAVETRGGSGDAAAVERCLISAELVGDVDARHDAVLRSILRSASDVLRYLMFLLGDGVQGSVGEGLLTALPGTGWQVDGVHSLASPTLLEPLVRAVGGGEETLGRVAAFIDELRAMPDGQELLPSELDSLWEVVWQAHQALLKEAAADGRDADDA